MYVNAYLLSMRMTFSVCHSYQVSSQQETGHLYFRAWNPVAFLHIFAMLYLPWNSEIGNLGRGLSYPHSFQTTTKLPLNLPTTAGKIHIGSKEGLVGKFLVSNIPMGGKTGKQNKKQTHCAVFFFMDVSGFGGFQRRFLWEVVKIWPKKNGGFQHRRPTNFSIPWRAGIGLIRFYARLSF